MRRSRTNLVSAALGAVLFLAPLAPAAAVQQQPAHDTLRQRTRSDIRVPDVRGRSATEAVRLLGDSGLRVARVDSVHADQGAGLITAQRPIPGTRVPRGTAESLTVTLAPVPLTMPAVIGRPEQAAVRALRKLGLTVIVVTRQESPGPSGRVIAQSPAPGARVRLTTTVTLTVAMPRRIGPVQVPAGWGRRSAPVYRRPSLAARKAYMSVAWAIAAVLEA